MVEFLENQIYAPSRNVLIIISDPVVKRSSKYNLTTACFEIEAMKMCNTP